MNKDFTFYDLCTRLFNLLGYNMTFTSYGNPDPDGENVYLRFFAPSNMTEQRVLNPNTLSTECIECVCERHINDLWVVPPNDEFFHRLMINDFKEELKQRGFDDLLSGSVQELELKLTLRGV